MHPIYKIDRYNIENKAYVTIQEIKTNFKEFCKMTNTKFKSIGKLHRKYGFNSVDDIYKHIKREDASGKTIGCGCTICYLRHRRYLIMKARRSYKRQLKAMDKLYTSLINRNSNYISPSAFERIFNRINSRQGSKLFGKRMLQKKLVTIYIPLIKHPINVISPTKKVYIDRILHLKNSLRKKMRYGEDSMIKLRNSERNLTNYILNTE